VEPRPLYWTLLALVVGGMLAAAIAFVLEYLRNYNKVRDPRDLEEATGLLTAGSVTEKRADIRRGGVARLVMLRHPRSDAAEMYRSLLARIGFSSGTARTLMVTSTDPSDAKSVVAANLALAYAESGRNVILVDADYRSPRINSFFGVPNDRGLTHLLSNPEIPLGFVTVPTAHPRLGLMPAGPPPPETSDPLGSLQVNTLLRRLLQATDMVVFDSPSMAASLDAAVLAAHVEGSVLVVPADSRADAAAEAAGALEGAAASVLGTVLYRRTRGSHGRNGSVPIVSTPRRPLPHSGTPNPPERIPASVTGAVPSPPRQQAAPASDQAQQRPPGNAGGSPSGPTQAPPSAGPFATPYQPGSASKEE
jgi:non-specific protein-tyrosine kinase